MLWKAAIKKSADQFRPTRMTDRCAIPPSAHSVCCRVAVRRPDGAGVHRSIGKRPRRSFLAGAVVLDRQFLALGDKTSRPVGTARRRAALGHAGPCPRRRLPLRRPPVQPGRHLDAGPQRRELARPRRTPVSAWVFAEVLSYRPDAARRPLRGRLGFAGMGPRAGGRRPEFAKEPFCKIRRPPARSKPSLPEAGDRRVSDNQTQLIAESASSSSLKSGMYSVGTFLRAASIETCGA